MDLTVFFLQIMRTLPPDPFNIESNFIWILGMEPDSGDKIKQEKCSQIFPINFTTITAIFDKIRNGNKCLIFNKIP